ncbi:uncharacterized protein LY79DRAFT_2928 [Colletotrichum navitas]|uniref:Uncharacterized protein n=1 Tax=Colletotrichum navitas TaxID=681940 RepID=A0AAD8QD27_9PEZI|nr:uncharacterized protein LY79DRAFT_2928 [Colletotrichum navitas]KAK1599979.1 hypothetical protein LY79DRAFT_2928 [Colletotrichum navitas]
MYEVCMFCSLPLAARGLLPRDMSFNGEEAGAYKRGRPNDDHHPLPLNRVRLATGFLRTPASIQFSLSPASRRVLHT